jgi:hypothetical protein
MELRSTFQFRKRTLPALSALTGTQRSFVMVGGADPSRGIPAVDKGTITLKVCPHLPTLDAN